LRLRRASSPAFTDAIELWRDDQDPQSLSWLRCRVLCAGDFWVASGTRSNSGPHCPKRLLLIPDHRPPSDAP
jgi:hypothetical protein